MSQVSRPMQIVLAAAVLFAAVWFVALRPKPASSTTAAATAQHAPGVKGLGTAVAKAHQAVTTANAAGQKAAGAATTGSNGGASATSTAGTPSHAGAPAATRRHGARTHHVTRAHRHRAHATLPGVRLVTRALRQHKAIAIAFVSPTVADARAVDVEIHHVGHFGGRAVTLSAPIGQLSRYDVITHNVQITAAPTTVIVAPNGDATTIVGFTDRSEIAQRLADVLAKHKH